MIFVETFGNEKRIFCINNKTGLLLRRISWKWHIPAISRIFYWSLNENSKENIQHLVDWSDSLIVWWWWCWYFVWPVSCVGRPPLASGSAWNTGTLLQLLCCSRAEKHEKRSEWQHVGGGGATLPDLTLIKQIINNTLETLNFMGNVFYFRKIITFGKIKK